MKTIAYVMASAALSAALSLSATPAFAQLLGGVVDTVTNVVESVSGGDGGGSGGLGGGTESGDVGISGVATFNVGSSDSGTNANGTVLGGGGGSDLSVPLGSLFGDNSGADLDLPGLDSILDAGNLDGLPDLGGLPGLPGLPGLGANGTNGTNGTNGINGSGGNGRTFFATRGGGGGSPIGVTGGSSRLKQLARILQNRAWLRFAQGNKVCLSNFGVANVASWVQPREHGALQQMIAAYGNDIRTLQQMMKRCRNGQNRVIDIGRVIGIQLKENGQIVVMTI